MSLLIWPSWSLYLLAGVIGAIMGSFANVCIARMPKGESVISPRSHCPRCNHRLKFWENIPVISYVLLLGRCSKCKERISIVYPVVELICILLSLALWRYYQNPIHYLVYFLLMIVPLVIMSFIDLKHMIIPDVISIPGIFVGFVVHTLLQSHGSYLNSFLNSFIGAVAGGLLLFAVAFAYEKIKKLEGLGGGDIKLIAMLGAFFGWRAVLIILLASSIVGSMVGLVLMLILRRDSKTPLPYGPFLAAAGILYLFLGERFISWYTSLLV